MALPDTRIAVLLALLCGTACNAQAQPNQSKGVAPKPIVATKQSHPKLIKTQHTGPGANVHCGLQAKNGKLWFGTTGEGLYCYNGRSFTNFTVKDGLSNNTVSAMVEDQAGNLWLGTGAGLCRYDGKAFTSIPVGTANAGMLPSFSAVSNTQSGSLAVQSMLLDKKGSVWLGTAEGVYRYDGKVFTRFLHNDGVSNKAALNLKTAQSIIEDRHGNIWFATWFEGICRYDGQSITSFRPNDEAWFSSVLEDKNGYIWAGRRGKGACRYNGKAFTNVLQHGDFDKCGASPLAVDKQGRIWFGAESASLTERQTLGGLWSYDGKTFKNFTVKDGLPNMAVFSVTIDKTENLWVGTRGLGLCSFDGRKFVNFTE